MKDEEDGVWKPKAEEVQWAPKKTKKGVKAEEAWEDEDADVERKEKQTSSERVLKPLSQQLKPIKNLKQSYLRQKPLDARLLLPAARGRPGETEAAELPLADDQTSLWLYYIKNSADWRAEAGAGEEVGLLWLLVVKKKKKKVDLLVSSGEKMKSRNIYAISERGSPAAAADVWS